MKCKQPETRRAKRTKEWLKYNKIPPSCKELQSKRNKEYYEKVLKPKRILEKLKYLSRLNEFTYSNTLMKEMMKIDFNYSVTLTYNKDLSMHAIFKDNKFLTQKLGKAFQIKSFSIVDHMPSHNHLHLLLQTKKEKDEIEAIFQWLFNSTSKGYVYVKKINDDEYRKQAIKYLMKKLNTGGGSHARQNQIDYWDFNFNPWLIPVAV